MVYKSLYRKYRPNTFENIVGQDAIIKILKNIVKNNKISHAYLFSGPRGTGKTSAAKLFAKAVNCLNPKDGLACNECEACKHIDDENTMDIIEIDAASNNGVDEIRELKNKINLVPSKCKYKVYIIDEVHMLSIGAFNALLKTLEEPPKHVIFILATTEIQKIPLTIISRCQNFNFKKISEQKIKDRLEYIINIEKIKIDDEALDEIARLSDGGMRDAIGLLEQTHSFADSKISIDDVYQISGAVSNSDINKLIEEIATNNLSQLFDDINIFYNEGKDFVKISEKMVVLLKDVLLYKKAPGFISNNKNHQNISLLLEENTVYKIINEINNNLFEMKISGHPKILFEIMCLKLLNLTPNEIDDTVKQAEKEVSTTIEEPTLPEILKEEKKEKIIEIELNKDEIEEYKKIIINNTLALADKKFKNEVETKWEQLNTYLINKDLNNAATILLDAKIISASQDHLLISYKYDTMVKKFNDLFTDIEIIISKIMGRKYKTIALCESEWEEIRPYYVNLKKENNLKILAEDNIVIVEPTKKNLKTNKKAKEIDEAINIFGEDLIEMKG